MKAVRVLSIIGIVFSALAFLCIAALIGEDPGAAAGWGVLVDLYLLAVSIVALCVVPKQ